MTEPSITCKACGVSFNKEDAKRNCSNCFACTGCIKYICPHCEEVFVEKDIKSTSAGSYHKQTEIKL